MYRFRVAAALPWVWMAAVAFGESQRVPDQGYPVQEPTSRQVLTIDVDIPLSSPPPTVQADPVEPSPRPPTWVTYSFFFTHLQHLEQAADEEAARGDEDGASAWRTHEQRAAGLSAPEGDLLKQVAYDCNQAVKDKDAEIAAAVTNFRDQYPDGQWLSAPVPPQLVTVWQERVEIIDQQVERLRSLLGEERFMALDSYIQANFSSTQVAGVPTPPVTGVVASTSDAIVGPASAESITVSSHTTVLPGQKAIAECRTVMNGPETNARYIAVGTRCGFFRQGTLVLAFDCPTGADAGCQALFSTIPGETYSTNANHRLYLFNFVPCLDFDEGHYDPLHYGVPRGISPPEFTESGDVLPGSPATCWSDSPLGIANTHGNDWTTTVVIPSEVSLYEGQSYQFSAIPAVVVWQLKQGPGNLDANGRYQAPASVSGAQTAVIEACNALNNADCATARITVTKLTLTVGPTGQEVLPAGKMTFKATIAPDTFDQRVTWTLVTGLGSINSDGEYVAPANKDLPATVNATVQACSKADPTLCGTATVTVPKVVITIDGTTPFLAEPGNTQTLVAKVKGPITPRDVTWVAVAGTVEPIGFLTARYTPPSIERVHIDDIQACLKDAGTICSEHFRLKLIPPIKIDDVEGLEAGQTEAAVLISGSGFGATPNVRFSDPFIQFTFVGGADVFILGTAAIPVSSGGKTVIVTVESSTDGITPTPGTKAVTVKPAVAFGGPTAVLAPAALTFADQIIGTTSAAQTVTLTNTGTAALVMIEIATDTGDFVRTNHCGVLLAAGASCTVDVTFTPTATGARGGTLRVTDNAPGSPHTVSLSGAGKYACTRCRAVRRRSSTIHLGESITLTAPEEDPSFAYTWYKGDRYDTVQPLASGGPTFTDTPPLGVNAYWVRTFTDAARTQSYDSEIAYITVVTGDAVAVDMSPTDGSIDAGAHVRLSARVNYPATFQWFEGSTYANSVPIPGAIGATLEVSPQSDTGYWVRATEPTGAQHDSAIVFVHVGCGAGPVVGIASQPMVPIVARPDTVLLAAIGTGKDLKYLWFTGEAGDTSHFRGGGQTIAVIAVDPVQKAWVRATDSCGQHYDSHAMSVYACLPRITSQPVADRPVIPADGSVTARLHVDAVSSNTVPPHYQWYRDAPGALPISIPNSDSADLAVGAAEAGTYWVDAIGTCTETLQSRATSDRVTVSTCTPPVVTTGSFPASVERNTTVTLSVQASGAGLTYQWYQVVSGLSSPIAGAQDSSYSFSATSDGSYWVLVKSNDACQSASATMSVAVCDKPVVSTPTAAESEVMPGASTTITVSASGTNLGYQWSQAATAGGPRQPVGTNASTLTTPPLNQDTSFWVDVTSGTCKRQSPLVAVHVCDMWALWTTLAGLTPLHSGDAVIIAFDGSPAPGSSTLAYWYRGTSGDLAHSTLIAGRTTAKAILVNPTETTSYWVRLQSTVANSSCHADTGTLTLKVCLPRIVQQPASIMIDPGIPTTLSVAVDVSPATYQWYAGSSGDTTTRVAGATGPSLTIAPAATTSYWVRVTGDCGAAVDSDTATVTVAQPTAIVAQPADASITTTGSATLSVTATGTNLVYQWYQGTAGNTSTLAGTNSPTVTVTPAIPTDYWVRVTGARGVVDSRTVHVSVCAPPTITAQPQSQTIFSGTAAALSVSATESTGEPKHYQWYRGPGISNPVGTDSPSYNTGALTAATQFSVRVTAGVCLANSALATVSMCTLPQTVGAPADQQIAVGATARLTGVLPMTGRSFRWFAGASGNTSAPVGGWVVGNILDVSPSVTTQYWYQVQDTSTGCLSNSGTTTVSVCIPHITQNPSATTIASGSVTTLSVVSDLPAATYQWYAGGSGNTASPIPGATTANLTVAPSVTTDYWVRVSGPCGQSVDSATATVTVCAPPVITAQPTDPPPIAANTGQAVPVSATGTDLTYQWYLGQTGDVSSPVAGATDSTLLLYSVPYTQYYWVRVSGACGSVNSGTVAISVNPTITQQPASTSVIWGSSATLSVRAAGAYLHYEWRNVLTGEVIGTDSSVLMTPPITAQTRFYCNVKSGSRGLTVSQPGVVSLCTGIVIYGVTVGAADLNNGCRWLSPNAITRAGDIIAWYKGGSGDTSQAFVGTKSSGSILACPADAGTYWYRISRGTCSGDSPAVTVP